MTLLMERKTRTAVRRCDSRCYLAQGTKECACICGGINHSAGLRQAIENVARVFIPLLRDAHPEMRLGRSVGRELTRVEHPRLPLAN